MGRRGCRHSNGRGRGRGRVVGLLELDSCRGQGLDVSVQDGVMEFLLFLLLMFILLPQLLILLLPLVVVVVQLLPEGWQRGKGEGRWRQSSFGTDYALLFLNRDLRKGRAARKGKSTTPGGCEGGDAVHLEEQGWDN